MTEIHFPQPEAMYAETTSAYVIRNPFGRWASRKKPKTWTDKVYKRAYYKSGPSAREAAHRANLELFEIVEVTMVDTHVYMRAEDEA